MNFVGWYQTLNHYRVANPPIQFHSLHPPPFAPKCKGLSLTEFCSGATRLSGRFSEGLLLRRSHILDTMDNATAEQYGALPNRLFVFDEEGRVIYPGGIGPHAYDPEIWLEAIEKTVAL